MNVANWKFSLIQLIDGRGVTKCYMVGNTISRVCPYLNEWNLLNSIRNMKKGDIIEVKTGNKIKVNGVEIDSSIAIEFCTMVERE